MYFDTTTITHEIRQLGFPELVSPDRMTQVKVPLPNHFFTEDALSTFFPNHTNVCYQHMTFICDIISKQYEQEPASRLSISIPLLMVINTLNLGNTEFSQHYKNKDVDAMAVYIGQIFEFIDFQDHTYETAINIGEPLEIQ